MSWNAVYNALTLIFLGLAAGAGVVTVAIAADVWRPPILAPAEATAPPPTQAALLSPTPSSSWTPSPTREPSATLPTTATVALTATGTPAPTATATATRTPGPTATSTVSPTASRAQPTATVTPTATWTPSATLPLTPSPAGSPGTPTPTLSPYPFMVQPGTPLLRDNFASAEAGCDWQGIAGQAVTARGEPVMDVEVRIAGDDFRETARVTGSNTAYGPSGWELVVGDAPTGGRYRVALWGGDQQVSPIVEIAFTGSCQQNLAIVNFVQTRPY